MKFSKRYPDFYHDFLLLIQRLNRSYMRIGRLSHYLGSGYILSYSNFGHKYRLPSGDLEALKPLFKPSPTDLAISGLSLLLHTPGCDYAYVEPSSCYHLLNHVSTQKGEGRVYVLDHRLDRLELIMTNGYLNDLHEQLTLFQSDSWKGFQSVHAPVAHVLENGEATPPVSLASSIDWSCLHAEQPCSNQAPEQTCAQDSGKTFKELTLESLLSEDTCMGLRSITFDQVGRLPLPRDVASVALLNPACCFFIRCGAQHASQWNEFYQQWSAREYRAWRLPNLEECFEAPTSCSRWVLLARDETFI